MASHLGGDSRTLYPDGRVTFFATRGLLDLRGGGLVGTAGGDMERGVAQAAILPRAPGSPALGGGVLAWLNDDEDHAQWEAAELQRRVTEVAILAGPPRMTRVIVGERNGLEVIVCSRCCADVEKRTNNWARCACGGLCCIRCAAMHCVRCGGDCAVPLSLDAALGSSPSEGPQFVDDIWTSDAAVTSTPLEATDPCTTFEDQGQDVNMRCSNCGFGTGPYWSSWSICRCGAISGERCASVCCQRCGTPSAAVG